MKVILRTNIDSLGKIGDVVNVANGYGRNYLLPKNKAVLATPGNQKIIEHEKKRYLFKEQKEIENLTALAEILKEVQLVFPCKVGEEDKIFGSVTSLDIANKLIDLGYEVDKRKVILDGPLKSLGNYNVKIKLHTQVIVDISVTLVQE